MGGTVIGVIRISGCLHFPHSPLCAEVRGCASASWTVQGTVKAAGFDVLRTLSCWVSTHMVSP